MLEGPCCPVRYGHADVTGVMGGDGWRSNGPRLWEADEERTVGATVACAYERAAAEAGIAQWGDMLDAATGEIIACDAVRGRIGDTTANHAAYLTVPGPFPPISADGELMLSHHSTEHAFEGGTALNGSCVVCACCL